MACDRLVSGVCKKGSKSGSARPCQGRDRGAQGVSRGLVSEHGSFPCSCGSTTTPSQHYCFSELNGRAFTGLGDGKECRLLCALGDECPATYLEHGLDEQTRIRLVSFSSAATRTTSGVLGNTLQGHLRRDVPSLWLIQPFAFLQRLPVDKNNSAATPARFHVEA